jgi:hypothetical protein
MLIDDRITDLSELRRFDMALLGVPDMTSQEIADTIRIWTERTGAEQIFLNCSENFQADNIKTDLVKKLSETGLNVKFGSDVLYSAASLREMAAANNCILVFKLSQVTASWIDEQIGLCQKLEIPVWGCIVCS